MDNLTILLLIILYIIGYIFIIYRIDNDYFKYLDLSELGGFVKLVIGFAFWWLLLILRILEVIWKEVFKKKEWD